MTNVLLLRLKPDVHKRNYHPINFRPPYTLKYVESLLLKEGGFYIKLIDQNIENLSFKDVVYIIKSLHIELIIIDVTTLNVKISLDFYRLIKDNKKIITIGVGQEITSNLEQYKFEKSCFDLVLPGEAELELINIIRKIGQGMPIEEVRKTYYNLSDNNVKHYEVENLNALPFPVYSREHLNKYYFLYPLKIGKRLIWGHILSSRGCVHNCIFCSQIMRESYGKKLRCRSAVNVVDEIEYLMRLGANIIAFDDDNFTGSRQHVEQICREIKSRNLTINWIVHARIDEADRRLLELMQDAGCVLLRFGIETGSEKILKTLFKTTSPDLWFKQAEEAVFTAKSLGISTACLFIIGAPGETKEDFHKTIKFAQKLSSDIVQACYFTPFPGSRAYQLFARQLKEKSLSEMYHYKKPLVNFSAMTDIELEKALGVFYRSCLLKPVFILKHFFCHALFYLNNPDVLLRLFSIFNIWRDNVIKKNISASKS